MYRRVLLSVALAALVLSSGLLIMPVTLVEAEQIDRGSWTSENTFTQYLGNGRFNATIYAGSAAFYNASASKYQPIDTTILSNSTHYYVKRGIYQLFISKDMSVSYPFMISRGNSSLLWKPVNAGYLDRSNYKIQVIRSLNTSATVLVNGSTITYLQFFGRNIDFRITVGTDIMKEELLINHVLVAALPSPSNYGMLPDNTFVGVISNYDKVNLNLTNTGVISENYSSTETVSLNYGSSFRLGLSPSIAWDNQTDIMGDHNNTVKVRNIFTFRNGVNKIGSGVPYNWIKNTVGPVVIDPSTTIQPASADTYIRSLYPTTNYDSETRMVTGDSFADTDEADRGFIKFTDFSSLPANTVITGVTLMLYEYSGAKDASSSASYTTYLNRLLQNWGASTATWNKYDGTNNWNTAGASGSGTDYDSDTSASLSVTYNNVGWLSFSGAVLTDDVKAYVNGTYANNYGWRMRTDGEYRGVAPYWEYIVYSSGYAVDTSLRPKLVITYEYAEYLTVYFHTGIGTLYLNGTSKANGTQTMFFLNQIANITSVPSSGYTFLYYKFNSSYYSISNPLYWTMNKNYTVHSYAYPITTVTSTATIGAKTAGTWFLILALLVGFGAIMLLAYRRQR